MRCLFLAGILCGVMLTAAVTFTLAIPASNDHWRGEIVDHGGGAWCLDRNGNIGWTWTAQPRSERGHLPIIMVPRLDRILILLASNCEQMRQSMAAAALKTRTPCPTFSDRAF